MPMNQSRHVFLNPQNAYEKAYATSKDLQDPYEKAYATSKDLQDTYEKTWATNVRKNPCNL